VGIGFTYLGTSPALLDYACAYRLEGVCIELNTSTVLTRKAVRRSRCFSARSTRASTAAAAKNSNVLHMSILSLSTEFSVRKVWSCRGRNLPYLGPIEHDRVPIENGED
jgi:hypothetical protein